MRLGKRFDMAIGLTFQLIEPDEDDGEHTPIALVALAGTPIGTVPLDLDDYEDARGSLTGLLTRNLTWLAEGALDDACEALIEDEDDEGEDEEGDG